MAVAGSSKDPSSISASADVVVDMFLDPNEDLANSTTLPQYEVMVWIATIDGRKPIGYNSSLVAPVQNLNHTNLYYSRFPCNLLTSS